MGFYDAKSGVYNSYTVLYVILRPCIGFSQLQVEKIACFCIIFVLIKIMHFL